MVSEAGHHPGRVYHGQDGALYLNGAPLYDEDGVPMQDDIRHKDVQLNAAAVNGLLAANVELVPAPGVGLAVVPVAVHMFLLNATDFVQVADTDQLAILYNGGSQIAELGIQAQVTAFLEASVDAALFADILGAASPSGIVPEENAAIDLDNNGATEYTTGTGSLSVRTFYRVVPFAAFGA